MVLRIFSAICQSVMFKGKQKYLDDMFAYLLMEVMPKYKTYSTAHLGRCLAAPAFPVLIKLVPFGSFPHVGFLQILRFPPTSYKHASR